MKTELEDLIHNACPTAERVTAYDEEAEFHVSVKSSVNFETLSEAFDVSNVDIRLVYEDRDEFLRVTLKVKS